MTQFEQENDLGRGGGEVDDATMREAQREGERRRSTATSDDPARRSHEEIDEEERDDRAEGFGPVHES
jgi:hypothetical protein